MKDVYNYYLLTERITFVLVKYRTDVVSTNRASETSLYVLQKNEKTHVLFDINLMDML